MQSERENTVGIVGLIIDTPKMILKAPDWKKQVYETMIEVPRKSGNTDKLILQFSGEVAETKKQLAGFKKGVEVMVGGKVRTKNEFERKPTIPSVKIYIEAEFVKVNDPPAQQQNEVCLKGNVCKDPVPRVTRRGVHVVSLMVAVSNGHSKADFVPCICWGEAADVASILKKGTYVEVMGRMQSREFKKYIDDIPNLMTAYEVTVAQLGVDEEEFKSLHGGGRSPKVKRKKGKEGKRNADFYEKQGNFTGRTAGGSMEDAGEGKKHGRKSADQGQSENSTDPAAGHEDH